MLEVGVPLRRAQRYYVRKEFKDYTLYLSKQSKELVCAVASERREML